MEMTIVDKVIDAVCEQGGITKEQLKSDYRDGMLPDYRHVCMYQLRKFGMTTVDIGKALNRDHTTVIYALKKIDDMMQHDERIKRIIVSMNLRIQEVAPKVYIAGKITGLVDLNRSRFERAEQLLHTHAVYPINPLKLNHDIGNTTGKWEDYMKVCISALVACKAIAVLDDWYDSKGAMLEVNLARSLGMKLWVLSADEQCIVKIID